MRWPLLHVELNAPPRAAEEQFDGCYVLHSNVPAAHIDTATIHARYKDLAHVEGAFRTLKTAQLKVQLVYVRVKSARADMCW